MVHNCPKQQHNTEYLLRNELLHLEKLIKNNHPYQVIKQIITSGRATRKKQCEQQQQL